MNTQIIRGNSTVTSELIESESLRLILNYFRKIEFGSLQLNFPNGKQLKFEGKEIGLAAKIEIKDLKVFDLLLEKSDIGFGEAYIQGLWDTDSIANVIEFAVRNRAALAKATIGQWHRIAIYKLRHFFNRNSNKGSRRNIKAHYDLGNSFYKLWLDETMTYSSAYWGNEQELSMAQAQINKYELLLSQLNAQPGEHILEIGCGWGGFAEFAARRGMKVTGITISQEQFDFATARVISQGLQDKVQILLKDYRDLEDQFDHVISIEMIEAVGEEFWPGYFAKIRQVLKESGTAAIQSITIKDAFFDQYRKGTDFIQQYVFPGGMLPCERELRNQVVSVFGQEPQFVRFGKDYAKTLSHWHLEFFRQKGAISKLGYSEEFQRLWRFYLGYCEGAFRGEQVNVVVMRFGRTLLNSR